MASTSNKNQVSDYNVKKKESLHMNKRMLDSNYGVHKETNFMELGSIPIFRGNQLDNNHIDVESMLRGIRSTNLEGHSFRASPEKKTLDHKSWFERPHIVYPEPYEHSLTQRPNYLN